MNRWKPNVTLALGTATLLLASGPTIAKQSCGSRGEASTHLAQIYHKHVVGRGTTLNGNTMCEMFMSESGTWPVLASEANTRNCIVADSKCWQQVPPVMGGRN